MAIRGSRCLQNLVDKFTNKSKPLYVQLVGEVVLTTYPVGGNVQNWIDKGVDTTNRLTAVHTMAPRAMAMATAEIASPEAGAAVPIYEELGIDLKPFGLTSEDLAGTHFTLWPLVFREACAEAFLEYLLLVPPTIMDSVYTFYLQNVEAASLEQMLDGLDKAAMEAAEAERKAAQAAEAKAERTPTPTPVKVELPEDNDIPNVKTGSVQSIGSGQ